MISRFTCVAFLALALSAHALPSRLQQEPDSQCSEITVLRTVTVAAQPSLQTGNQGDLKQSPAPNVEKRQEGNQTTSSEIPKPTSAVLNGGGERNGGKTGENKGGKGNNNGGNKNNGGGGGNNGGNNGGINNNNGGVNNTGGVNNNGGNNNNNGGNNGGNGGNNGDPQTSPTLNPAVIGKGFQNDGQDVPAPGQVRSLTSTNNFINFCLTVPNSQITNGKQVAGGSCNPIPMGSIPSSDQMPSAKFIFPPNMGTIKAGQTFTIEMAISKMETGFFVNAQSNYFGAPQQLNNGGQIKGHSHVVVEKLDSLDQTRPTDPKTFAFFKGLNGAAQNGKLTTSVDNGLQPGVYRMSSINTSSNHQPVVVPIAQHGSLDDAVYFTVTVDGKPARGSK